MMKIDTELVDYGILAVEMNCCIVHVAANITAVAWYFDVRDTFDERQRLKNGDGLCQREWLEA